MFEYGKHKFVYGENIKLTRVSETDLIYLNLNKNQKKKLYFS